MNNVATLKSKLEVTQGHCHETGTIRKLGYGFLFAFRSNYGSMLYHFRDKARYWSKISIFSYSFSNPLAFDVPVAVVVLR